MNGFSVFSYYDRPLLALSHQPENYNWAQQWRPLTREGIFLPPYKKGCLALVSSMCQLPDYRAVTVAVKGRWPPALPPLMDTFAAETVPSLPVKAEARKSAVEQLAPFTEAPFFSCCKNNIMKISFVSTTLS